MTERYDANWAAGTVAQLHELGVRFAPGLDTAALDAIAGAFGVPVPQELAVFLRAGVPVSPGWARWLAEAEEVAEEAASQPPRVPVWEDLLSLFGATPASP